MPKLRKDTEDSILELIDQGFTNIEVSERTGVHRKTIAKRRRDNEKVKHEENLEPEPDETIKPEPSESPLDQQIDTLIKCQGTNSREEAIQQAIVTQRSLNPYIHNHGLKTTSELIEFFEGEIKEQDERIKDISADRERYLDRLMELLLVSIRE